MSFKLNLEVENCYLEYCCQLLQHVILIAQVVAQRKALANVILNVRQHTNCTLVLQVTRVSVRICFL